MVATILDACSPLTAPTYSSGFDPEPNETLHEVICTPPPAIGTPAVVAVLVGTDAVDPCTADELSRERGVPARCAHPAASGPLGSHTIKPSGTSADAARALTRAPRCAGHPAVARATTDTIAAITHTPVNASIQLNFVPLPVPRPCSTATGQLAYTSQ
jgi:hypothetical protein